MSKKALTKNSVGAGANRDLIAELKQLTRQCLSENGEQPDYWIITGQESQGKIRFFCSAPPFPVWQGTGGPLLDLAQTGQVGLALLLTIERGEIETLVCATSGFLSNLLSEETFDPEDFPTGYADVTRTRRRDSVTTALRAAIQEMLRLGYARLTATASAQLFGSTNELELIVRPDGGMALRNFGPDVTLGQLSEALAGLAVKAKLIRMRQGARNCGGCGRCCSDPEIPLTYFDVGNVAAYRFADLYQRSPEAALAQAHSTLAFPKAALDTSLLPAARLYFRKRDGSGGADSPCVFLDGRGLCGVYEGRPLLCRLYHCAEPSAALEHLYKSAFYTIEWLGRVVESGLLRPSHSIMLPELLELPVAKLASPYALFKVAEEISGKSVSQ